VISGKLRPALILIVALLLPAAAAAQGLLQPKYHLPESAFAYVGDAEQPATWKLPYRHADGSIDRRRLPLAIEAALGTYRGRHAGIPASALPGVLDKLARAADAIGKMPPRASHPSPLYRKLAAAVARPRASTGN
jgi:hypothetical protein